MIVTRTFYALTAGALQSLRSSEQTRERLEEEVRSVNRDRSELTEQLSIVGRQKNALAEELINTRKDLERQSDAVLRLSKNKEELTKEKAELAVQITACERENRQQGEVRIYHLESTRRVHPAIEVERFSNKVHNNS